MTHLLALSIRQPWAWFILHAGKDIENRSWPTKVRGTVAVHAAQGMTQEEYFLATADAMDIGALSLKPGGWGVPSPHTIDRGGIIGLVDIIDCVAESPSPWFFGPYGFVLANPRPVPFIACRGALGFWRVPDAIASEIREAAHG